MYTESINKLHYRYEVKELSDLSNETFQRRIIKSAQNNRNSFLYVIENDNLSLSDLIVFFNSNMRNQDLILINYDKSTALKNSLNNDNQIIISLKNKEDADVINPSEIEQNTFLCSPTTKNDLHDLISLYQKFSNIKLFWSFNTYNKKIKNSLTVSDIGKFSHLYKKIKGLEIVNSNIPRQYELIPTIEKSYQIDWVFCSPNSKPKITVVIPTYNNVQFLTNTVLHLIRQNLDSDNFEIIIVDDGSTDMSSQILKTLFKIYKDKINIKYIYWTKHHPDRGSQQFFRTGLARNLGAHYSKSDKIIFLDSDMLVPNNFIDRCLNNISENTLIQFQRFHISQHLSKNNPLYDNVNITNDTYVEESHYWSEFFFCDHWMNLPDYWKYTCTYALGITKADFYNLGMFKKYYVSYGFEDTDLGYEAYLQKYNFKLIKTPLLHQTSYNKMQYNNSKYKRHKLLKKTAELFYLQHLSDEIYNLLGNYYKFQKPIKSFLKDLLF